MNKSFSQSSIKGLCILLLTHMFSCTKTDRLVNKIHENSTSQTGQRDDQEENNDIIKWDDELEGEDELISDELFKQWEGLYLMENNVTDGWGRESIFHVELNMAAPDNCIFKCWLEDENEIRYAKNDSYNEYVGGIYATVDKDSIEFFTKKIIEGGNESLAPLLTLKKNNKDYFIYSFLTSPPHNGIVEMPIQKIK
ncbi:hypothetical protein [Chryseobacterium sp.]|uniref:hypothetical protein n=1 Tax=Chryseobacterium sp. TaxID=1871047 RepID=UPI0032198131